MLGERDTSASRPVGQQPTAKEDHEGWVTAVAMTKEAKVEEEEDSFREPEKPSIRADMMKPPRKRRKAPTPRRGQEEPRLVKKRRVEANAPETNHNDRTTNGSTSHDRRPARPRADKVESLSKLSRLEDKDKAGTTRSRDPKKATPSTRSASQGNQTKRRSRERRSGHDEPPREKRNPPSNTPGGKKD